MIRYAFLSQFDPPAPFVNTVLRNPASGAELGNVPVHPEESWILLGRDVLNAYRILLDGPQRALEIG